MGGTSQRKRILLGAITATIVWISIELMAGGVLWVLARRGVPAPSPGAIGQADREANSGPEHLQRKSRLEEIHPYLGYVLRDVTGGLPDVPGIGLNSFGYLDVSEPLHRRAPDRLIVAVFGGSVAELFSYHGVAALEAALRADPRMASRRLVIVRLALAGYKQPQQLMSLAYLLSLGAEFDVVVNIDGFNEVALHGAENHWQGVSPVFPRQWSHRTASVMDPRRQALIREALDLERRRDELVDLSRKSFFRISFLWRLARRVENGRLARRLTDLQRELAQTAWDEGSEASKGPALELADGEEVLTHLVAIWRRSSEEMAVLARANDIRYLHVLQPNQYVEGSKPMGPDERRIATPPDHPYRDGAVLGYPLLRAESGRLRASGVEFYDATGLFADVEGST